MDEAICIASLVVAIVAKLVRLRTSNQSWRRYRHDLITENKWRAVRYGIDGKLIDFGRQQEAPTRSLALEMLDVVDDVLDELNLRGPPDRRLPPDTGPPGCGGSLDRGNAGRLRLKRSYNSCVRTSSRVSRNLSMCSSSMVRAGSILRTFRPGRRTRTKPRDNSS